jgi:hypothetical protein
VTTPDTELAARVATAVQAERAAKIDELGRDATLWLALVPLWTRSAAEAAAFPAPSVVEFVKRARDAGWCETRGSLRDAGSAQLRFWMPDETRRVVLDLLTRQERRTRIQDEAANVAVRVASLSSATGAGAALHEVVLPGALRSWAELAVTASGQDRLLVDRVQRAVEAGDLGAAQQLVSAGEALAPLVAGPMELAVDRARRLLSLGTRRRRDHRALERYLDRPELSDAVTRLLRPETAQWALHLRGAGGAGKTMLIRYLAAGRYAAERGLSAIPVTRADFDHMSPDYPVRRPVQLLLELADELALHTAAVSQADRALAQFRATAASVHESLSGLREEHPAPLQNPQVLDAIDTFADALAQFPEQVLLILDTCEELAKADSGDPAAPAVRTTLAIVERIHERAPGVRVLFAGRWPLPPRPYLDVREIAGFTVDEARRYLAEFAERPLPAELADAMIRQSPATDAPVPAPGQLPERVSPFDLALYQSWADEDPELDLDRVAEGSDAYIEGRIIERLHDPVLVRALPVLACAGRCRVTTIAAFLGADPAVLGPRLAEQEWIDAGGDPPEHVTAKPGLARRLRRYFSAGGRAAGFNTETARLAQLLRGQANGAPVGEIDPDELLAALRLSGPAVAAALWDDIASRAAASGRWNWTLNVTRRVLGESADEQWPSADALRSTVLASYIAASRRASPLFDARAAWAEAGAWSGRHPDPVAGTFLATRAALGTLPYAPDDAAAWEAAQSGLSLMFYSDARSAELAAAAVDALHRLLEEGAEAAAERLLSAGGGPAMWSARAPDAAAAQIRAWALVALARLRADDDRNIAVRALDEAESLVVRRTRTTRTITTTTAVPWTGRTKTTTDTLTSEHTTQAAAAPEWPDWTPPDDLLARVRIEYGLIAPPGDEVLEAWEAYAADRLGSIDGERLASLCLRIRLGRGVIEPSVIERWQERDSYQRDRAATCSAHDLVPPLCATLAEAWLAAGDPRRGLDLVAERRAAALETRDDDVTVRIADAQTVRIARRLRLFDERSLLLRLSSPREFDPSRADLVDSARLAWAVINRTAPRGVGAEVWDRPAGWHAWWQCQPNWQVALAFPRWPADSTGTELAAEIELDLEELRAHGHPQLADLEAELAGWLARPRGRPRARSADPYRDVRAGLRRAVLDGGSPAPHRELPQRLLAELAFEEAELLALRFPEPASTLFLYARDAYLACGDDLGSLLATASAAAADPSGHLPRLPAVAASVARLRASRPGVAAALTDETAASVVWRRWSGLLDQLGLPPAKAQSLAPAAGRKIAAGADAAADAVAALFRLLGSAVVAACAVAFAVAVCLIVVHLVRYDLVLVLSLAGAFAALAAAGAAALRVRRVRSLVPLAEHRAVGAVFAPQTLGFSVLVEGVGQPGNGRVDLWAHLRPLAAAPRSQWPRLMLLALAAYLMSLVMAAFGGSFLVGYVGLFRDSGAKDGQLTWIDDAPEAAAGWWADGTAAGVIYLSPADASWPWERIITASLGPDAAGRVEWHRQLFVPGRRSVQHDGTAAGLDAPDEWRRFLDVDYQAGAPATEPPSQEQAAAGEPPVQVPDAAVAAEPLVQVRHAIGRAVATSAGPRLDVADERPGASGAGGLLGPDELGRGAPSLIVLQAEPSAEQAATGARDDLAEKLALAVDLLTAGAAPQVLILPALRADLAAKAAQSITGHAATGAGASARALQANLRDRLRPSVAPAVLDDIVLFVNVSGYNGSRQ